MVEKKGVEQKRTSGSLVCVSSPMGDGVRGGSCCWSDNVESLLSSLSDTGLRGFLIFGRPAADWPAGRFLPLLDIRALKFNRRLRKLVNNGGRFHKYYVFCV